MINYKCSRYRLLYTIVILIVIWPMCGLAETNPPAEDPRDASDKEIRLLRAEVKMLRRVVERQREEIERLEKTSATSRPVATSQSSEPEQIDRPKRMVDILRMVPRKFMPEGKATKPRIDAINDWARKNVFGQNVCIEICAESLDQPGKIIGRLIEPVEIQDRDIYGKVTAIFENDEVAELSKVGQNQAVRIIGSPVCRQIRRDATRLTA